MINEELLIQLRNNECLLADGYESALIGITEGSNPVAVYDMDLCIKSLVEEGDITEDYALEHFYFNTVGAYMGEKTPIFIKRYE